MDISSVSPQAIQYTEKELDKKAEKAFSAYPGNPLYRIYSGALDWDRCGLGRKIKTFINACCRMYVEAPVNTMEDRVWIGVNAGATHYMTNNDATTESTAKAAVKEVGNSIVNDISRSFIHYFYDEWQLSILRSGLTKLEQESLTQGESFIGTNVP